MDFARARARPRLACSAVPPPAHRAARNPGASLGADGAWSAGGSCGGMIAAREEDRSWPWPAAEPEPETEPRRLRESASFSFSAVASSGWRTVEASSVEPTSVAEASEQADATTVAAATAAPMAMSGGIVADGLGIAEGGAVAIGRECEDATGGAATSGDTVADGAFNEDAGFQEGTPPFDAAKWAGPP